MGDRSTHAQQGWWVVGHPRPLIAFQPVQARCQHGCPPPVGTLVLERCDLPCGNCGRGRGGGGTCVFVCVCAYEGEWGSRSPYASRVNRGVQCSLQRGQQTCEPVARRQTYRRIPHHRTEAICHCKPNHSNSKHCSERDRLFCEQIGDAGRWPCACRTTCDPPPGTRHRTQQHQPSVVEQTKTKFTITLVTLTLRRTTSHHNRAGSIPGKSRLASTFASLAGIIVSDGGTSGGGVWAIARQPSQFKNQRRGLQKSKVKKT
jgi:hypothetical protein